jgi:hypothetical protein
LLQVSSTAKGALQQIFKKSPILYTSLNQMNIKQ